MEDLFTQMLFEQWKLVEAVKTECNCNVWGTCLRGQRLRRFAKGHNNYVVHRGEEAPDASVNWKVYLGEKCCIPAINRKQRHIALP